MSDDTPKLDLTKKRKKRRLGPDGEYVTNREVLIPSPAYDPRELKDVLYTDKRLVKHKAKERFQSMGERTLPKGYPATQFQFERAVKQNDTESLKHLVKHWIDESDGIQSSGLWIKAGDTVEFNFPPDQAKRGKVWTDTVWIAVDKDAHVDGLDLVAALSNPGSAAWNAIDVIVPGMNRQKDDRMMLYQLSGKVLQHDQFNIGTKGTHVAVIQRRLLAGQKDHA